MICTHSHSLTKFTYTTKYQVVRANGKITAVSTKREPGVLVQYRNGRKHWKANSEFDHIEGMPLSKGEVYQKDL